MHPYQTDILPQYQPEVLPQYQPEVLPQYEPEVMHPYQTEVLAQYQPEVLPQYQPEVLPQYQPEVLSQHKTEVLFPRVSEVLKQALINFNHMSSALGRDSNPRSWNSPAVITLTNIDLQTTSTKHHVLIFMLYRHTTLHMASFQWFVIYQHQIGDKESMPTASLMSFSMCAKKDHYIKNIYIFL